MIFMIRIIRIYIFYGKYKFYNILLLCIHELCELSNYFMLTSIPLMQYFFNEMHFKISDAIRIRRILQR